MEFVNLRALFVNPPLVLTNNVVTAFVKMLRLLVVQQDVTVPITPVKRLFVMILLSSAQPLPM
jgi:hypothetical protein